ncbi:MAG: Rne/Rng family ribonuclease [Desulfobacteraceae bacterium]|jgi:ribonuclease G
MATELVINTRHHETRVAVVENGTIAEIHIERETGQELMGNIYRGTVVRVLPGMQAAFVDIGLERTGFLYVSDVHRNMVDVEQALAQQALNAGGDGEEEALPSAIADISFHIEELLHVGQDVMVQVSKEPMGTKGARLTSHISLPGRHLVLMPTVEHIGVSRRIEDSGERERLRALVREMAPDHLGFIVRTVSEGANREKLQSEMDFILKLWESIREAMHRSTSPALLYKDLAVSLRAVRDLFTREVDRLVIDSQEEYNRITAFIETFAPRLRHSVELYEGKEPIYDHYGIEVDISRALEEKIWLKSGGYIVIEITEALTAIDVNTGSYVGRRNLEETILKTNLEAVKEIAYQLRLRNIGGLIVIDFIDMERRPNRDRVFTALKEAMKKDRAKTHILRMSELGLIEMTRKRTRESLNRQLEEPCFYCEGRGSLKSRQTICYEIFRGLERETAAGSADEKIFVKVHPEIEHTLKEDEHESVLHMEKRLNRRIIITGCSDFHLEQYEISS